MKIKNKKKKGFTLIELVIVLAVLAIIALIAIPNFTKVRNDSLKKADIESCNQIEKITLMAIANEDIIYSGEGYIKIDFTSGNLELQTSSSDPRKADPSENLILKADKDGKKVYESYLKDIKAPQYKEAKMYVVKITATGEVSTSTEKIDEDGQEIAM